MKKIDLTSFEQLDQINEASFTAPQLLYKHSTTCGLCDIMWEEIVQSDFTINYLDLHQFRPISNEIESKYNVQHESPQILLIRDGKCVYNASHRRIKNVDIQKHLDENK